MAFVPLLAAILRRSLDPDQIPPMKNTSILTSASTEKAETIAFANNGCEMLEAPRESTVIEI
jgi:hypothetical protein